MRYRLESPDSVVEELRDFHRDVSFQSESDHNQHSPSGDPAFVIMFEKCQMSTVALKP